jgi:hypothetical protein
MTTKRIELEISKLYDKYSKEKHELINYSKIIEYLFNKPMSKITKIEDLITDYESSMKIVRLEEKDKNNIVFNFDTMNGFFDKYMYFLHKSEYAKKMNLLQIKTSSKEAQLINNILFKCENPFKMSYISNWTFQTKGEHISLSKKPTINIEEKYTHDFFGLTMVHGQLVLFVIEYDDEFKFKNYTNEEHVNDIFQQFMLFQMNINLLRLNKKSDFKKEIVKFLKKIRNTTEYVIQNPIEPIIKAFSTLPISVMKERMDQFMIDYEYNRMIYLKYPGKSKPNYDSDDEDFFEKQEIIGTKEFNDEEFEVNNDAIEKILEEKEYYHTDGEAGKMVIELLGHDDKYKASIISDDALECISKMKNGSNKNPRKETMSINANTLETNDDAFPVELVGDINKNKPKKKIVICNEALECISKLRNGSNKNPENKNILKSGIDINKNTLKSNKDLSVELVGTKIKCDKKLNKITLSKK